MSDPISNNAARISSSNSASRTTLDKLNKSLSRSNPIQPAKPKRPHGRQEAIL